MSVRDLLRGKRTNVVTIEPDATVDAAVRLLVRHDIGGLPVATPGGPLVGFIAEREIAKAIGMNSGSIQLLPVSRIMRSPAPTCSADDTLHEAMARMTHERLRHMVVMDDDTIVGIISVGDLVKHRLEQLEVETGVLRDYVTGQRALR